MNHEEQRFAEMLKSAPFDDAYRPQHRDDVCERALRAFDEAAAQRPLTVADRTNPPRRFITRRRAIQLTAAAAIAASLAAVLLTWQPTNDPPRGNPVAQSEAQRRADESLLAAVSVLNDLADDRDSVAFDRAFAVCLIDREGQIALADQ
jgi:hypothetical protein